MIPDPVQRFEVMPGTHARRIRVQFERDPALSAAVLADPEAGLDAPPEGADPSEIVAAFLRGVSAGCLGQVPAGTALAPDPEGDLAFRASLPALPEGALQVLGNMAAASAQLGSGVTAITVQELVDPHPPARASLGLASLSAPAAPFAAPPFAAEIRKEPRLLITFGRDLAPREVDEVERAVRAWAGLVTGGFPAPNLPILSLSPIEGVAPHLDDEIVVRLSVFAGGEEAWHALARALAQIHRDLAPVRSLEIL